MNHPQHDLRRQPNEEPLIPPFLEPLVEHYHSLPPITRAWFTLSFVATALNTLDVIPSTQLILIWDRVPPPHLELWRLLTSFVWAGPGTLMDFSVLMLLYSMVVVVPSFEADPNEACFLEDEAEAEGQGEHDNQNNTSTGQIRGVMRRRKRRKHTQSDCLFAFLVCATFILVTYLLITETSFVDQLVQHFNLRPIMYHHLILTPVFTRTLLYCIITLDSLKHPDRQVNINFFPVPGRYVPLFHVVFGMLMGYRIQETIVGIVIGWIYKCLVEEEGSLAVLVGRKRVIHTPQWLIHLMGEDLGGEYYTIIVDDDVNTIETRYDLDHNDTILNAGGIALEPGANVLHRAAAIGDLSFLTRYAEEMEVTLATAASAVEIASATAPFRQQDRNGWQPLHEAAREGHFDVLKFLLEIEDVQGQESGDALDDANSRRWRRRAGKLRINVNARTNNGIGCTALWLLEHEHGVDSNGAKLLRDIGGVSLGYGDEVQADDR